MSSQHAVAARSIEYAFINDESLVLASLIGDFGAFDELTRRHRAAVIVTAQHAGATRTAAEDVAQDVFLVAFQTLPTLEEPARFGAWLRAIARFRALRVAERDRRTAATEAVDLEALSERHNSASPMDTGDPAGRHQRSAERQAVWTALDRLSREHREVLFLHYCEEWPLARIAAALAVPETTVKGRLFRAREAMRRVLVTDDNTRIEKGK